MDRNFAPDLADRRHHRPMALADTSGPFVDNRHMLPVGDRRRRRPVVVVHRRRLADRRQLVDRKQPVDHRQPVDLPIVDWASDMPGPNMEAELRHWMGNRVVRSRWRLGKLWMK